MTDKEQIIETYRRMYKAMVDKDMDVLEQVLDDSMTLVHMTGRKQDKRGYIDSIADGTLNYFSEETESMEIEADDDHAALIGKSHVEAAVYGGNRCMWKLRLDMKLIKKDGVWRFTEGRASMY